MYWQFCLAGNVTVGLLTHRPRVTVHSGISTYGLNGQKLGTHYPCPRAVSTARGVRGHGRPK